ncbi:phosphopantetheine-binding protein [Streptomyces sp. NPDC002812]|uniref:acyl carrier protein n=1 Tax=unclassified Streptomyces TaxID=2593676 RepID=UPI00202FB4A8|nr:MULTISPECIES: phosphopantetheine-binding protein [unclassified Streptomyces]MCM1971884.1 phosphopantetheine-binding protein [Streptomyces sp. G1]MCX5130321.1 phosphopantetheine-binding protein [Streptomyces sp. NBC_00347]MCX5301702.1 phosphopantetheine-binding protein [Streptomyces sp. NBC_00193]
MSTPVRAFVVNTLETMNLDIAGVTDDTPIGDDGLELESLTTAELVMQVEEEYGVKFSDEDVEGLQTLTIGEFVSQVEQRRTQVTAQAGSA